MTVKERYEGVIATFQQTMPDPQTELVYDTPFHLLISVILSAQCTDKRVNMISPELWRAFPTPADMAKVEPEDVFPYISSITFPNNKSRHLVNAARKIVADFDGEVPSEIDKLTTIPGVGRKTANVMLAVVWNRSAMPVDTHVFRVSERIGLTTRSKNPLQTERTLVKYLPEELVSKAHHWLILHGRYVCKARRPQCEECALTPFCRAYKRGKF